MFFIMGISQGEKRLSFHQTMVCKVCGKFGRLEVFMTYTYFTLFFLPIFRWNVKYYATAACCGSVYLLNKDLGKKIARGEAVTLTDEDLTNTVHQSNYGGDLRCSRCGYQCSSDFIYCPKCGNRLL